jgi:hypothetical protein
MAKDGGNKPSKAVHRASGDLRKGVGDAGLAMEERRQIKTLTSTVKKLERKVEQLEKQVKGQKKSR